LHYPILRFASPSYNVGILLDQYSCELHFIATVQGNQTLCGQLRKTLEFWVCTVFINGDCFYLGHGKT